MRAVIQRVAEASVATGEEVVGSIGPGICVLLGIGKDDTENAASRLAAKIANLRIFEDGEGKMNRSITEQGGAVLVISQDLDELLTLTDRLAVINVGVLSGALVTADASLDEIGLLMGGLHGMAEHVPGQEGAVHVA